MCSTARLVPSKSSSAMAVTMPSRSAVCCVTGVTRHLAVLPMASHCLVAKFHVCDQTWYHPLLRTILMQMCMSHLLHTFGQDMCSAILDSLQLQMVTDLLLERGDSILVEEYTYFYMVDSVLPVKGYHAVSVKMDNQGICPRNLRQVHYC